MPHPIYHLELKIDRCQVRVRLNGIPVAELTARTDQPEWFAPPINPYLVGSSNQVELEVSPLVGGQPAEDFSVVNVEATVRRYEKGMPVAPDAGPVVRELPFNAVLAERIRQAKEQDQELSVPQSLLESFDNEVVSFAAELSAAAPLADLEAIKDYALKLRDLLRAGSVPALVAELSPKVQAYALAYDEPEARMAESLEQVLRDGYLGRGIQTDFEREDLELLPCAGGRLCELRRPKGAPLIESAPDHKGNTMQIPVVVGMHQGKLGVVR